jgi:hypothetical protein
MDETKRNSRANERVEFIPDGEVDECQHCGRMTWPITRNENGRHIEQCLYCLQRYDVAMTETDEDEE